MSNDGKFRPGKSANHTRKKPGCSGAEGFGAVRRPSVELLEGVKASNYGRHAFHFLTWISDRYSRLAPFL